MTYAVLQVPARAYMGVRAKIAALPRADYGHMIDRPVRQGDHEHLLFDRIALEAEPLRMVETQPAGLRRREELAEIVEMIARDGLPGPRDLDVALDAILSVFGEEHADR